MKRALFIAFLPAFLFAAEPAIRLTEIDHQSQPGYRIETPAATWIYHREGAGFASLLDAEGHDWISYRPQGGAAGHYRGIPNAVYRRSHDSDNFFHPGHSGPRGSETALVSATAERVVLRSRSTNGRWSCEWEILPDRARLRLLTAPEVDGNYWFLYEGTPGGRFEPTDLCVRPDGRVTPLSERWESTIAETPWVAFVSVARKRALLLVAHERDATAVSYRPMENAMTVFGFGRRLGNLANLLTEPRTFTVMFVNDADPAAIARKATTVVP